VSGGSDEAKYKSKVAWKGERNCEENGQKKCYAHGRAKDDDAGSMKGARGAVRLQKFIADAGLTSRRGAEGMVIEGRVSVNGQKVTKLGAKIDPARDSVKVDGKLVKPRGAPKIYLLFNKPAGYVTSVGDYNGRETVMDVAPRKFGRLFPVGRLDMNSEGLIILTNDGDMAQRISHPSSQIVKTYEVKVRGSVDDDALGRMRRGVVSRGQRLAPAGVRLMRHLEGGAWLEFRLIEGKNREIRRICEALGLRVSKLRRVAIGKIKLGLLEPGEWRLVTRHELDMALRK
jgi:23S rRNA pseudouridine2605 synthase